MFWRAKAGPLGGVLCHRVDGDGDGAISLFTAEGIAAALYYIVHSTLAAAALFLIADLVRQGGKDLILPQPPVAGARLTAGLFFVGALRWQGCRPCRVSGQVAGA